MTYPPPPPPEDPMQLPQLPGAIQLPINALRTLSQYYVNFHWLIRLTGQKVPPELDRTLREIASGNNPGAVQNLQEMAYGPIDRNYEVDPQDIPNSQRIGERVLTQDMARHAWEMHFKEGLSYRQIAAEFTNAGYPVAFTTIANYIDEVDDEMRAMRHDLRNKILRGLFFVSLPIMGAVAGHFLW